MAGDAILREHLRAAFGRLGVVRMPAERQNILDDIVHLRAVQNAVLEEARHLVLARLLIGFPANAMRDGRLDVVERAAPQPVVVIEVREARAALSARPMARRAIVAE